MDGNCQTEFGAMSIQVLTPATTTLLSTLDTVKLELGLDVDTDDVLLDRLLQRASDAITRECQRVFGRETVVETLQGSGGSLIGLTRRPVVSITEVLEDSVVVDPAQYVIEDAEVGALRRTSGGWVKGSESRMWGQEAFASGYILPGGTAYNYIVTYVAGFVLPPEVSPTLPGDVEQACIETVRDWYSRSGGSSTGSPTSLQVGMLRVQYSASSSSSSTNGRLPQIALDLLRNYKGYR